MSSKELSIGGRSIGPNHPPFIICELSANHQGSLERALELVDAAAKTGADAIKIQTYTPDTMTIDHTGDDFFIKEGPWRGQTLYDLYSAAFTPYDWHEKLLQRARELGITLFSTPFDETAVSLLAKLDVPAYKIASFEAIDLALIELVSGQRRPVIISTGMADRQEISDAVSTAKRAGAQDIILLHCVSCYPAEFRHANLATIRDLAETYDTVVGLSDHTVGTACAVAAVALGASVIEKHFTLDRRDGGPDSAFSLEPHEFRNLVDDCRNAWLSIGQVNYGRSAAERANKIYRRSLYVVQAIETGEIITSQNVRIIRPGFGLAPKFLSAVIGQRAVRNLERGHALNWDDLTLDI